MYWKPVVWSTLTETNVILNPSDSYDRKRDIILARQNNHLERVYQMLRRFSMKTKTHVRGEIGSDPEDPNIHSHVIVSVLDADHDTFLARQHRFQPDFEWNTLCLVWSPDSRFQNKAHRRLISDRFSWDAWEGGHNTYGYTLGKHQNQGTFIVCPKTARCRTQCVYDIQNPSTTGISQNLT